MFRTAIARQARLFSTTTRYNKSAIDAAKDTLKQVDRTVSDTLVSGIEKTEAAAAKGKDALPSTGEIKGKASELSGQASGKAQELKGAAKGKAEEAKGTELPSSGEIKSKASELSGQASGKAAELKGQAKGKAEEVKGKM